MAHTNEPTKNGPNPAAAPPPTGAAQSVYTAAVTLGTLTLDPSVHYMPVYGQLYQLNIQIPASIADGTIRWYRHWERCDSAGRMHYGEELGAGGGNVVRPVEMRAFLLPMCEAAEL